MGYDIKHHSALYRPKRTPQTYPIWLSEGADYLAINGEVEQQIPKLATANFSEKAMTELGKLRITYKDKLTGEVILKTHDPKSGTPRFRLPKQGCHLRGGL